MATAWRKVKKNMSITIQDMLKSLLWEIQTMPSMIIRLSMESLLKDFRADENNRNYRIN